MKAHGLAGSSRATRQPYTQASPTDTSTKEMTAPLSLIVTAFAPVEDVRRSLTPQLKTDQGPTALLLIDLSAGRQRMGFSALAQAYNRFGEMKLPSSLSFFGGRRFVPIVTTVVLGLCGLVIPLIWPWFAAGITGQAKNALYQRALELKGEV